MTIQDLKDRHGDETVEKALWLAHNLRANGLEAVRFMATAEHWARRNSDEIVAKNIEKEMRRL